MFVAARRLWGLAISLVALGWPAVSQASPVTIAPPGPDEVYFVLGVPESDTVLQIESLLVKNGVAQGFKFSVVPHHYRAQDQYILVKAHADELLGVEAVSMTLGRTFFGAHFVNCGKVPAFQSRGGKVVYVTTADYELAPYRGGMEFYLDTHFSQDLAGARAFLNTHYPILANSVEPGSFEMIDLPGRARCR